MVSYQPAKHPTLGEVPWVLARPQGPAILGFLPDYARSLRDGRVNRSDGLVLWRTGGRIIWNVSGTLSAQRLDGRRSFRIGLTGSSDGAVAEPRFPTAGCWRLSFRSGTKAAAIVARVIPRPAKLRCNATLLESGAAYARPRSSGIRGLWPWQSSGAASLTTHGHDGDRNMKVPWWVRRGWGGSLSLLGTRLDAPGSFRQEFPNATYDGSQGQGGVFPSIVDVPAAGCWVLRLRTAQLAGVVVTRAVDAR
jgi:hypothetical protein